MENYDFNGSDNLCLHVCYPFSDHHAHCYVSCVVCVFNVWPYRVLYAKRDVIVDLNLTIMTGRPWRDAMIVEIIEQRLSGIAVRFQNTAVRMNAYASI